jgi:hypothetical protein
MHNSIPEYVSTTSISTAMNTPFHVKPFEKKVFEEVVFLLKYYQNPQVLKRWSVEKREREKNIEKREKRKKEQMEKREKKKSFKSLFK